MLSCPRVPFGPCSIAVLEQRWKAGQDGVIKWWLWLSIRPSLPTPHLPSPILRIPNPICSSESESIEDGV